MELLESTADLVNEAENLVDWSEKEWYDAATCKCHPSALPRDVALRTLFQLQLCTARMCNVEIDGWMRPKSLKAYIAGERRRSITTGTTKKAFQVMLAQLRPLCVECLRQMRVMIETLEEGYRCLRRHRLHPHSGSLLVLLFGQIIPKSKWCINPKQAIRGLLSPHGLHPGHPMRTERAFRFLPHQDTHELLREDLRAFELGIAAQLKREGLTPEEPVAVLHLTDGNRKCARDYLERFRPLLGLPYANVTPVWQLVQPRTPQDPAIIANCYGAYESTIKIDRSLLGTFLAECEKENKERKYV